MPVLITLLYDTTHCDDARHSVNSNHGAAPTKDTEYLSSLFILINPPDCECTAAVLPGSKCQ